MITKQAFRTILASALGALLIAAWTAAATACPTCKLALAESDPVHQRMVAGYFYSILFMMSAPFILLGSFCTYAYILVRRARKARSAESGKRAAALAESVALGDERVTDAAASGWTAPFSKT